jgi:FkbM family methyltransferase
VIHKIVAIIILIIKHPHNRNNKLRAVLRFIAWQLSQRLFPYPSMYSVSRNSRILVSRGLTGATGCIYFGLSEFIDMLFVLHFMRKEDLFLDVGSNVGVYSVLVGCEIGCDVIAIEPIPETYLRLVENIKINHLEEFVDARNIGLAEVAGELIFSSNYDTVNHVIKSDSEIDGVRVHVDTLDNVCTKCPELIKIDVEGYETKVLIGANRLLKDPALKVVIVEINGSGNKYGHKDQEISNILTENGFHCYSYNPFTREIIKSSVGSEGNAIFIRDKIFVESRLKSNVKICVGNQKY